MLNNAEIIRLCRISEEDLENPLLREPALALATAVRMIRSDCSQLDPLLYKMIQRVYPALIAQEIVKIQPMGMNHLESSTENGSAKTGTTQGAEPGV